MGANVTNKLCCYPAYFRYQGGSHRFFFDSVADISRSCHRAAIYFDSSTYLVATSMFLSKCASSREPEYCFLVIKGRNKFASFIEG